MKAIFLIVIGSALVISVAGYLLFSHILRKSGNSYYWRAVKKKQSPRERIMQKFIEDDRHTKAYKETIRYTVQCRNSANKVMNEIIGLYTQKAENLLIRRIDLQVLEHLEEELKSIQSNISAEFDNALDKNLGDPIKSLESMKNNFSELCQLVNKILQTTDAQRNEILFISEAKVSSEHLYYEIAAIHKHLIGLFQEKFSEIESENK